MFFNVSTYNGRKGVAMLPVVMVLGGVMVESVLVLTFLSYSLGQSGLGDRLSSEAFAAAQSGAMDAVRKVVRNKDFFDTDGYELTVGDRVAAVTVTKDVPAVGKTRVVSLGTALFRQRKIQVDLSVNSTTGGVEIISLSEINL